MSEKPVPIAANATPFDVERSLGVVEDMLAEARKLGATAAEAGVSVEA